MNKHKRTIKELQDKVRALQGHVGNLLNEIGYRQGVQEASDAALAKAQADAVNYRLRIKSLESALKQKNTELKERDVEIYGLKREAVRYEAMVNLHKYWVEDLIISNTGLTEAANRAGSPSEPSSPTNE